MTNAMIVHGTYGHPKENWFQWLKKELGERGCDVSVPQFPTPEGQRLENWMAVFEEYTRYLSEDTLMVGHSTGSAFILNVLERTETPIKAAFLTSGFTNWTSGMDEIDKLNESFTKREFDWESIRGNCEKFYVFHGDDDPYVPMTRAQRLAEKLETEVIVVDGGGHLNEESGYTTFPELLERIEQELS